MSTRTTNFNFLKPELSDIPDITQTNENWDKIDSIMKKPVLDAFLNENTLSVNVNFTIYDGSEIVFKAPCNSSEFQTFLINSNVQNAIYTTSFTIKNSAQESIHGLINIFKTGSYVSLVLDVTNNIAYIQNEATTVVQDNSITSQKLASELKDKINLAQIPSLSGRPFKTVLYQEFLDTYFGQKTLQGIAYNSEQDKILLCFNDITTNVNPGLLVELDSSWEFVRKVEAAIGHGNDATFNPNTNRYYIATSLTDLGIAVIDPTDLTVESYISVASIFGESNRSIGQISYDVINDIYWIMDSNGNLYTVQSDFSGLIYKGSSPSDTIVPSSYQNITKFYSQGSCCYNENFILLTWMSGTYPDTPNSYARLNFYNPNGEIHAFFDYRCNHTNDEAEGIVVINDAIYSVGYRSPNLYVVEIVPNGNGFFEDYMIVKNYSLFTGQTINAGSALAEKTIALTTINGYKPVAAYHDKLSNLNVIPNHVQLYTDSLGDYRVRGKYTNIGSDVANSVSATVNVLYVKNM